MSDPGLPRERFSLQDEQFVLLFPIPGRDVWLYGTDAGFFREFTTALLEEITADPTIADADLRTCPVKGRPRRVMVWRTPLNRLGDPTPKTVDATVGSVTMGWASVYGGIFWLGYEPKTRTWLIGDRFEPVVGGNITVGVH